MNERNLSRRLAAGVVDTLKARGHILVVKGGATALARELDELMTPEITTIAPRLRPRSLLVGEPTSTFGDEAVDQSVEDMVVKLTHALMNSDHVEDVFAEDAVIRRDIFRVVRDGLRDPPGEIGLGGDEPGGHISVTVKLDALGYVAATASRRADASTLRLALDRAASVTHARFSGFSPELREATFRLEGGGPDERLEIEEAVADELTDLVEQGLVELPTVERTVELPRAIAPSERRALRARIDAAADATLARAGCVAAWEIADPRTLRVLFTPLSDQDARAVDAPTTAFAREVATILASTSNGADGAALAGGEAGARVPAPPASPRKPAAAADLAPEPAAAEPASTPARRPATRAKKAAAAAEPPPKRAASSKPAAKRTTESAPAKRASATTAKATKAPAKKR